ncbi:MAG: hypothetical protein AMJ73_07625 [candidate division Zixibacteria bacterium SM1_73]|nr:MAG: hypothetical protein AMJ73_07625 [candidate division Zixibacteria bacterium SM1_73]
MFSKIEKGITEKLPSERQLECSPLGEPRKGCIFRENNGQAEARILCLEIGDPGDLTLYLFPNSDSLP